MNYQSNTNLTNNQNQQEDLNSMNNFKAIPFVCDARTNQPVAISEVEGYTFFNGEEDLYLMEVVLKVLDTARGEGRQLMQSQIPHNFSLDLQLMQFVRKTMSGEIMDLQEFKALDVWEQSYLEYDQAVLLSMIF